MFIIDDIIGGLFGSFNNMMTNDMNEMIASRNIEMQRATNEANKQMVRETNLSNRKINEATNKANLDIASAYNANQIQLQNDMNNFNKAMWNLNNAYNSPAQQLERARAAGINPNIVFGQPVAASPVQQTSIPSQQMAQMQAYYEQAPKENSPHNDMKYQSSWLEQLGKGLSSLGKLPFVKEQLDLLKEEVRGMRADNDTKEYDLQGKKDADAFYNGAAFYRHHDGSYITGDDFEKLSDKEKENYLNQSEPYVSINGERKPNYDAYRLPFKNKAEYEAYKDVLNFPNFKANISADMQQNKLREYVAKYQISAKDANGNPSIIYALAHMPQAQYNNLQETLSKLMKENKWLDDSRDLRYDILRLEDKQLENAVNNDLKTWIDRIGNEDMGWRDWLKMALVVAATFR